MPYHTTTREGYREYKSASIVCAACPLLSVCTESRNHQKVITRHIWKDCLEICEDIRHQRGMKGSFIRSAKRRLNDSLERLFGTAKEYHNLRYTREIGKSKMEDKFELTLACLNLKKLVKLMAGKPFYFALNSRLPRLFSTVLSFYSTYKKRQTLEFVFGLKKFYISSNFK
ncbi:transposase [Lactococcus garvieae]|uniref:transposase n=1 Tax=Lactococcus garvieae TaxID=1363 RepID=UPI003B97DCA1